MELDDFETSSSYSDYSILPDSNEVEVMASMEPEMAGPEGCSPSVLQNKAFQEVEFLNVCDSCCKDQDLVLYYTFKGSRSPLVTDRLAIYQVGFCSLQQYIAYQWAPRTPVASPPANLLKNDNGGAKIYSVTFHMKDLDCDESEFYQVAYLDDHHRIKGTCSPFELLAAAGEPNNIPGVSAIEQSDGSVLVTSDLSSLQANNNMLQEQIKSSEAQIKHLKTLLNQRDNAFTECSLENSALQQENESLRQRRRSDDVGYNANVMELENKMFQYKDERNVLQVTLEEARLTIANLETKIAMNLEREAEVKQNSVELEARIEEMKKAMEAQVNIEEGLREQLTNTSDQLSAVKQKQEILQIEFRILQKNFDDTESQLETSMDELDTARLDYAALHEKHLCLCEKHESTMEEFELLKQKVAEQEDKLNGRRSLESHKLTEVEQCRQELKDSEDRRAVLDSDNKALQGDLRRLQDENRQLQTRLDETDGRREGAESVAAVMRKEVCDLQKRLIDLHSDNEVLHKKFMAVSEYIMSKNEAECIDTLLKIHACWQVKEDEEPTVSSDLAKLNKGAPTFSAGVSSMTSSFASLDVSSSANDQTNESGVIEKGTRNNCSTPDTALSGGWDSSVCDVAKSMRNWLNYIPSEVAADCETNAQSQESTEADTSVDEKTVEEPFTTLETNHETSANNDSSHEDNDSSLNTTSSHEGNDSSFNSETSHEDNDSSFNSETSHEDNNTSLGDASSTIANSSDNTETSDCSVQEDATVCSNDSEDDAEETCTDAPTQLPSHDVLQGNGKSADSAFLNMIEVSNCRLTAPVFWPTSGGQLNLFVAKKANSHSNKRTEQPCCTPGLPPPLLPEMTQAARHAATLVRSKYVAYPQFDNIKRTSPSTANRTSPIGLSFNSSKQAYRKVDWSQGPTSSNSSMLENTRMLLSTKRDWPEMSLGQDDIDQINRHIRQSEERIHAFSIWDRNFIKDALKRTDSVPSDQGMNAVSGMPSAPAEEDISIGEAILGRDALALDESASALDESASALDESASALDESASALDESASALDESASALGEVATEGAVGGAPAPVVTIEPKNAAQSKEQYLHCPMCPLEFGRTKWGLMHEHIESHLEFICPICSTAFQRSQEKAFHEHVNAHLDAEERAPRRDNSGPWGRDNSSSWGRGFISWPEVD